VASGAIGSRERGGEKRSLTSPGARRKRSAPAATEPRRHPDPAAAAVLRNLESRRPEGRGLFHPIIFNRKKLVLRPLLHRASLRLGCFKFRTLPTDGERFLWSERTHSSSHPTGRRGRRARQRRSEHGVARMHLSRSSGGCSCRIFQAPTARVLTIYLIARCTIRSFSPCF
jgi:hypothetical protein